MKTKIKGLIVAVFFAVILLTSTVTLAFNGTPKQSPLDQMTITGTPADNFLDMERPRYCGTGDAKSNAYVKEFKIPTQCTQPLAITTDQQGNVWFAQTNTGNIAKFNPMTQQFTEYDNPDWQDTDQSMMWGMDYSYDGSIWYTDDAFDSIWKFSTADGTYKAIDYPANGDSLPQHLKVAGSQIIVNDFYGGKISFFDTRQENTYKNIPSPIPDSFVGGFDVDSQGNVWYTNWILRQGGALIKFDYTGFSDYTAANNEDNSTALQYLEAFNLPSSLGTPVGLSVDQNDNVWIADTSSSSFYKFSPSDEKFTRYVTSDARQSTYGNATGVIKSPITGPYWTQIDDGRLVFNEQIANAIAVFDVEDEWLVEYQVPSQNPNWADCADANCGIAQVFGFKSVGDKIWFTEWVENNIGVVDLAKDLPLEFALTQKEVILARGQSAQVDLHIAPSLIGVSLLTKTTAGFDDITVTIQLTNSAPQGPQTIPISIAASESALPGTYKVLIYARTNDVTVSQFVTVTIIQ